MYVVLALIAGVALGWGGKHIVDQHRNEVLPDNISSEEKQRIISILKGTYTPRGKDCPRFVFDETRVRIFCYKLGPVTFDGIDQEYEYSHEQHLIRIPIHILEEDGIELNHTVTLEWNEVNEIGDEHGTILSKRKSSDPDSPQSP